MAQVKQLVRFVSVGLCPDNNFWTKLHVTYINDMVALIDTIQVKFDQGNESKFKVRAGEQRAQQNAVIAYTGWEAYLNLKL